MIDTIRLKTNISDFNRKKLTNYNCIEDDDLVYEVFKSGLNLGSYQPNIAFFISHNEIKIEFSVPKQIYGNNIEYAYFRDIVPLLERIKQSLELTFGIKFIDNPKLWEVQRIDICEYIPSTNIDMLLERIKSTSYSRQSKYVYPTSVMFKGRTFSTKVYKKGDEFFKHDFKRIFAINPEMAIKLHNSSRSLLRMEIGYRSEFLKKHLNLKKVTVIDIIKNKKIILKHFKMVKKKIYINTPIENLTDQTIKNTYIEKLGNTKGNQLYYFYKEYFKNETSRNRLKKIMDLKTYYKRRKQMQELIPKTHLSEPLCFGKPLTAPEQSVLNRLEQYIQN